MSPLGFLKRNQPETEERGRADCGFLVFENTSEVIQAEKLLKKMGWKTRVMGPPPEIRKGCDLVIEFPLIEEPFCYLAGDIGRGDGSEKLYQYLVQDLKGTDFHTIVFHYLQPHIGWHSRILSAIQKLAKKPILIADAGFMYVAKMSGRSNAYDLFTPDIGELAFLADELAPHPFYTRGFLLPEFCIKITF